MNDQILSLMVLAFAGTLIIPLAILMTWLEKRSERHRSEHTPAE
jgi:hypothetical protein